MWDRSQHANSKKQKLKYLGRDKQNILRYHLDCVLQNTRVSQVWEVINKSLLNVQLAYKCPENFVQKKKNGLT